MRISDWSSDVCSSDLEYITVEFEHGDGVALNGTAMSPATLLAALNDLGRRHGIGRLDLVENRFVGKIGRASCRERVCQYVSISVVAVSLKKKINNRSVTVTIILNTQYHHD